MNTRVRYSPVIVLCCLLVGCKANSESAGSFTNPATIGSSITRYDEPLRQYEIALTVSDVLVGNNAEQLAKNTLDVETYSIPSTENEYLAVKVIFDVKRGLNGNSIPLYPSWHVTLRYQETGDDNACLNWREMVTRADPPYRAETWLFFIVQKGSKPELYFQPFRDSSSKEYRTSGAFFSLNTT